jgi:hypothetical protein
MKQSIIGYHQDDENDWVAQLECGHHHSNSEHYNKTTQIE